MPVGFARTVAVAREPATVSFITSEPGLPGALAAEVCGASAAIAEVGV